MRHGSLYVDPATKLLDSRRLDLEPERGAHGFTPMNVRGINMEKRQVTCLVSTGNVDRYGEIVLPEAVEKSIPQFMKNPVMLAGHQHTTLDGTCPVIGTWKRLRRVDSGIEGVAEFMTDDPLAESWWKRYAQGVLKAFSIGFMGLAWTMESVSVEGKPERVRVWRELELLEISACTVPANRESLVRRFGMKPAGGGQSRLLNGGGRSVEVDDDLRAILANQRDGESRGIEVDDDLRAILGG